MILLIYKTYIHRVCVLGDKIMASLQIVQQEGIPIEYC